MEFVKKLCVVVVLAALSYGAYATLTTRPPADAPPEAAGTDTLVAVEAPPVTTPAPAATTPAASNNAPAAPAFSPAAAPPAPAFNPPAAASPAPAFSPAAAAAPAALPSGPAPLPITPSPQDSTMSPSPVPSSPVTSPTSLPGVSISTHDDGTAPVAVVTGIDTNPANLDPLGDFRADYTKSQDMLRRGNLGEALLVLSPWCEDERLPAAEREPLIDLLDQLAGTVVYSRDYQLEPPYAVQPGDTLESIAERHDVPPKLLANINGISDAQGVRAGDKLKVVRGPFNALVDLKNYQLTLIVQGRYAGRFRIGVGTDMGSDVGVTEQQLEVRNKLEHPPYYGQNAVVDADDPNNPLGGYWIDLGNKIGIHGTNDPRLIGRTEGPGAIRLSSRDVVDVYNILSKKSQVVIHR